MTVKEVKLTSKPKNSPVMVSSESFGLQEIQSYFDRVYPHAKIEDSFKKQNSLQQPHQSSPPKTPF